ncbi:uncharacterized protein LOC112056226 [Bicyclus anynana]|uniref:Uncharacterized protein LOC112056226 n=1 Tax=Bicyclus anynana TaxID=110368 RepID=A0A6J1P4C2_BICAN|nr:uncharacterized protein LOC112056226 [Bicyclus anynana]
MNFRLMTKQRLIVLCVILALVISAIFLKLLYIQDNYEGSKTSIERCFTELTSTKYQLNVVTEYKNRIDKLLTEMEKKQKLEKERFRDVMDSCVAMKQQSLICQSQFEDLQSECKKVKEDYDKVKQEMEKAKPTR